MGIIDINFRNISLDEKNSKIFSFMTFHIKVLIWAQYRCVLGSMK